MASTDTTTSRSEGQQRVAAPSISLPKGGGAIRGIGEKFAANPVTGTGSMTVPIATSPGRSGFGPQLTLSYDSGSANGPFGFGWSLALPSITRKTDKGLPQYNDVDESDVFILSGAEDLVPVLQSAGTQHDDTSTASGYTIRRYRPRIEGLFARIERWTRASDGDVHWRSISKDNILTLYGKDDHSRIFDPEARWRIFTWLVCESRDDKGNAVLYGYKSEDGAGLDAQGRDGVDLSKACERNRGGRDDPRRTANRYIKSIRYGNRNPLLHDDGRRPRFIADLPPLQVESAGWMFEVVFDYGEHDTNEPEPNDAGLWSYRSDPFSSYRSGFEIRTTRMCQRVLMFHHIPELDTGEKGYEGLVRSTDFVYSHQRDPSSERNPVYTFLQSATQSGYKRSNSGYLKKSLPPVEYEYTQPIVQTTVHDVDAASLENLPIGVDSGTYQWTDLHGEGIPGILTDQSGAWFYKRNISPISERHVEFGPLERVATRPSLSLAAGHAQFMDLAGDGLPDLVVLDGDMPGLYEHDDAESWESFRPFASRLNRDMRDANLKFVDLDGDGHADVLITEENAFVWHSSLAESGFGPARRVAQAFDDERGPRLVFADGTQSIHLADLDGDGLTDLVRIRNGEVCYWPSLGYGRFGAKVTMDGAPQFDNPDQFDHKGIRLADIDGTGTTDLIYLHRNGVRLYFNQSGNSWSRTQYLNAFPPVDDITSIATTDLLGNGTACLVWSSPLPGDARRSMRYVNLMGAHKPHLLVGTTNNLGAETVVQYASSTKFYLQDKRDGKSWITRLPFPVHVVERVETYDRISRNRFVSRYAYHHGYFDGEEREFRGWGMVEQWDTEELEALSQSGALLGASNIDDASHVPPVHTKTWFHTGVYLGRDRVSNFFAGLLDDRDVGEYYPDRTGGDAIADATAKTSLLDDTLLPRGLTLDEEREACRALKGAMLRQEVYALDGTLRAAHPYTVAEQNFAIRRLQPREGNRHAVFLTHAREVINYQYERNPADPRISHALTLEVNDFGDVLQSVAIGYGRRQPDPSLPLQADRDQQTKTFITYTENRVTIPVDDLERDPDAYRAPLPCETRTYELTGFRLANNATRFSLDEWVEDNFALLKAAVQINYEQIADLTNKQKRLIEHVRTRYRANSMSGLLPLTRLQSLALPGESYMLALTLDLATQVFVDSGKLSLNSLNTVLADEAKYVHSEGDSHWWIPSGRIFFSPGSTDTAAQELRHARQHFFLPRRYRDPFHADSIGTESLVTYDPYDLLLVETLDALGNRVTVGVRDEAGSMISMGNDYRVLQPRLVMGANRNRTEVAFEVLGLVAGTAVMGKPEENLGDSLAGFQADLSEAVLLEHLDNPMADPHAILGRATSRLVYDLFAYQRTKNQPDPQPAVVYTMASEAHAADLELGQRAKVQHSFSYSDGFGREIQRKIQAEPGPVVPGGAIISPRWVGSGWTIFNNKGKPVRQYEPFFSELPEKRHRFEFAKQVGVSSVLFYDPIERVVAILHPNHTWEKVVVDPWRQETWDVNDTTLGDPRTDTDIKGFTKHYFATLTRPGSWQTWHAQREGSALGEDEQAAARKAAAHANTPTTAAFDTLGRPFLTLSDNGSDPAQPDQHLLFATRVDLDIEGNQRAVRDAMKQAGDQQGRVVMRYTYDVLGNRIHEINMEAGARWMLNDVAGKPIRAWDSRGHIFRTEYDPLRRPLRSFVTGADPANHDQELLTERLVYGEQHPQAELRNLRGKLYLHLDQCGSLATEAHDFKGNPLRAARCVTNGTHYRHAVDWRVVDADHVALPLDVSAVLDPDALAAALAQLLETDAYVGGISYDALNRPVTLTTPHTSAMEPSVIRHSYNEASLLERVEANLRGASALGQPVWTPFVTKIDYDAKGQHQRIDYGNGASTFYDYDPDTFRLVRLLTLRNAAAFPDDCPEPPPNDWPGCQLQNLHYTYDPVGNITHIRDEAQQTIYFNNKRVEPTADYRYDATYRLIEASGREHLGQIGGAPTPHSHNDAPRVGIDWAANDGRAMGTYTEGYLYDSVGNFLKMEHRGTNPAHPGWTRTYTYAETSLIEDGIGSAPLKINNRLSSTTVGNNGSPPDRYVYDAHGSTMRMPHLGGAHPDPNMHWDYQDQLRRTDLDGGGTAYYVYDAAGRRVRKVWEKSANFIEERLDLGAFEIFRRRNGAGTVLLSRESLHIVDDEKRIALVETRTLDTAGNDPAPQQLLRYQFGNQLGSASLELDDQAHIISYEEYTPYGSTSYQAVRSHTETPKRYRYTGKERDEESGLYYHGARNYAPWLGRWVSADPDALRVVSIRAPATEGSDESAVEAEKATPDGEPDQGASKDIALLTGLFLFNKSNPVRFQDPDGRHPVDKAARKLASRFVRQFGEKQAERLVKKSGSMASRRLAEKGILPNVAKHIAEHFKEIPEKVVHTVFSKEFRKTDKIAGLVQETLTKAGRSPTLSRADSGALTWVFEKEFGKALGKEGERVATKLRVVVDLEGRLVTAFPVTEFLENVAVGGLRVSAKLAASLIVVETIYAGEAEAATDAKKKSDELNDATAWYEWLLPFDVSRIAPDPPFHRIRERAEKAISDVEAQSGVTLSDEERGQIRRDVEEIWLSTF